MRTYDNTQRLGELLQAYKKKKEDIDSMNADSVFWDKVKQSDEELYKSLQHTYEESENYIKENKAVISGEKEQLKSLKVALEDEMLKIIDEDDRPIVKSSVKLPNIGSITYERVKKDTFNASNDDMREMGEWAIMNGLTDLLTLNVDKIIEMSNENEKMGGTPIKGVTHSQSIKITIR